jgi:hypothetical protein
LQYLFQKVFMFEIVKHNKPINRTNTRWLGSLRSQYSQQVFAVH